MSGILMQRVAGKTSGGSGLTLYDGFASTRGYIPTNVSGVTHDNVRTGHWARSDLTQIKIAVFNYYGANETGPGATMSVTASVEYPAGNILGALVFPSSGIAPNGGTLISNYLTLSRTIPNGERYWIRLHRTCSAGLVYISTAAFINRNTEYMGDCYEDSATDRTMSGDIPDTESSLGYYTAVISPTTAPTVLVIGDSIDAGVTDFLDVNGDLGIITRTIGSDFGYFNAGVPGETANGFISNHTQRLLLKPFCTHVPVGFGTNDIFAGDSAATIEGHLSTIYGLFSDKTVFGRTMVPRTSGPWDTTSGQTVQGTEGVRLTLNADLRSTFGPPGGVFNITPAVEASAGKWMVNKTDDGIHPNVAGYAAVKNSGAINKALFGTPATLIAETGSAWGDHGTLVTVATRRRTNDTISNNSGSNTSTTARGATSHNSGKFSWEIECIATASFIIGLMTGATALGAGSSSALDDYCGSITDSFGIANGAAYNFVGGTIFAATSVGSFAGLTNAGDVWGMDVDVDNRFAYLRRNGVYFLGGVPTSGATGTGHIATWGGSPSLYPGLTIYAGVDRIVRLRTASLLYAPPSGYSAWG